MRTSRGLPFNACVNARACTCILGKPAHLNLNHELDQGVAPPGLTHLTYRWRERASEHVRGASKKRHYALMCMSNHPDLTSNHLQSF